MIRDDQAARAQAMLVLGTQRITRKETGTVCLPKQDVGFGRYWDIHFEDLHNVHVLLNFCRFLFG